MNDPFQRAFEAAQRAYDNMTPEDNEEVDQEMLDNNDRIGDVDFDIPEPDDREDEAKNWGGMDYP